MKRITNFQRFRNNSVQCESYDALRRLTHASAAPPFTPICASHPTAALSWRMRKIRKMPTNEFFVRYEQTNLTQRIL